MVARQYVAPSTHRYRVGNKAVATHAPRQFPVLDASSPHDRTSFFNEEHLATAVRCSMLPPSLPYRSPPVNPTKIFEPQ
jgi:hypothetical protein